MGGQSSSQISWGGDGPSPNAFELQRGDEPSPLHKKERGKIILARRWSCYKHVFLNASDCFYLLMKMGGCWQLNFHEPKAPSFDAESGGPDPRGGAADRLSNPQPEAVQRQHGENPRERCGGPGLVFRRVGQPATLCAGESRVGGPRKSVCRPLAGPRRGHGRPGGLCRQSGGGGRGTGEGPGGTGAGGAITESPGRRGRALSAGGGGER